MRFVILAALLLPLAPAPAFGWGKTGHRVIGAIAAEHMTGRSRKAVRRLLGSETLAEASTWPDEMRADPAPFWQDTANPWHYVTVPAGSTYAQAGAPAEGDAVTALTRFSATVRDACAPLADRQLALRFIVHIVGDLHQPLHAGNGTDRGGNDRKVTFRGEPTNLHSVWDSGIVDGQQLSFTEMATWLDARTTRADVHAWSAAGPADWIAESATLRDRIYPQGDVVSGRYVYANMPHVELRLRQGGVRLASYLDRLFADGAAGRRCRAAPALSGARYKSEP